MTKSASELECALHLIWCCTIPKSVIQRKSMIILRTRTLGITFCFGFGFWLGALALWPIDLFPWLPGGRGLYSQFTAQFTSWLEWAADAGKQKKYRAERAVVLDQHEHAAVAMGPPVVVW